MKVHEGVKLQLCYLLHHINDVQLRHRVEYTISFAQGYMGALQGPMLKNFFAQSSILLHKLGCFPWKFLSDYPDDKRCFICMTLLASTEKLARDKHSSLFCHNVDYTNKKFYCFGLLFPNL